MSFCFDVKQEICAQEEKNKRAMFYGMLLFGDKTGDGRLQVISENVFVINILEQLASELFGVHFMMDESANAFIASLEGDAFYEVCSAYHISPSAVQLHLNEDILEDETAVSAFLKGAFLVAGSVNNPYSAYHLELVTHYYQFSKEMSAFLEKHGLPFKSVMRKSHYVLYLKDSVIMEQFLYMLGAQKAAFDLVNAKIYKQVQNDNNRLNNCQGYNRDKTMDKSIAQILAIRRIESDRGGLDTLSEDLKEVCELRLKNQYASLSELSALSGGKYSKAGLSRRLSKIIEISGTNEGTNQ